LNISKPPFLSNTATTTSTDKVAKAHLIPLYQTHRKHHDQLHAPIWLTATSLSIAAPHLRPRTLSSLTSSAAVAKNNRLKSEKPREKKTSQRGEVLQDVMALPVPRWVLLLTATTRGETLRLRYVETLDYLLFVAALVASFSTCANASMSIFRRAEHFFDRHALGLIALSGCR